jgi:3-dehydroquinate synthase II
VGAGADVCKITIVSTSNLDVLEVETSGSVLRSFLFPRRLQTTRCIAGAGVVTAGRAASGGASGQRRVAWATHAVTALRPGARLYVLRSEAARHVGMEVEEHLVER